NPDQVGVASFSSTNAGRLDQELTQNAGPAEQAIRNLYASGMTNIQEGLELAETELNSPRHGDNAPVIVILSDGYHNETTPGELLATAGRIKRSGIRIISIGLGSGVDEDQLRGIASSDDDYYYAPGSGDLAGIYQSI